MFKYLFVFKDLISSLPKAAGVQAGVSDTAEAHVGSGPRSSKDNGSSVQKTRTSKFKRAMCCVGWIFLCPLCCVIMALREKPQDMQDLEDDPCLPCWRRREQT